MKRTPASRPTVERVRFQIACTLLLAVSLACNLPIAPNVGIAPSTQFPAPPAVNIVPPTVPVSMAVCQDEACMANGMSLSYLVVTRPLFVEALIPFVNWKTSQGYRVGVVTVDWLSTRFTGRHLAESMKTGMHTLRKQTGAQFVLLVGDTEIERKNFDVSAALASYTLASPWNVPTGYYRHLDIDPPGVVVASDTYFVEDRDWDPQNTGLNPRPENTEYGTGRIDAALLLGRWPVRKPEEIAPIFAKTQRLTPTNKILFTWDASFVPPSLDEYMQQCPQTPFPEWGCYEISHARLRLFGENAPWLATDSLAVDINNSQQGEQNRQILSTFDGVIAEHFHGNYDFLAMPGSEELLTHDYRILVMASCMAFAFYSGTPDTYSETILKSPSGTPIIASSPNDYMFLSYLREGRTVGEAFWRSAAVLWGGGSTPLLGDPSLQVFQPSPATP